MSVCVCVRGSVLQGSVFQGSVGGGSVYALWGSVLYFSIVLQGNVGGGSAADRERVIFSCPDQHYTLTLCW